MPVDSFWVFFFFYEYTFGRFGRFFTVFDTSLYIIMYAGRVDMHLGITYLHRRMTKHWAVRRSVV